MNINQHTLKYGIIIGILLLVTGTIGTSIYYASKNNQHRELSLNANDPVVSFIIHRTDELVSRYNQKFQRLSVFPEIISQQAAYFLMYADLFGKLSEKIQSNSILAVKDSLKETSTVSSEISTKLQALSHLDMLLKQTIDQSSECTASFVVIDKYMGRFYPKMYSYLSMLSQKIDHLVNNNSSIDFKTKWTDIFITDENKHAIAAITPIVVDHRYSGIAGISVRLDLLNIDIRQLFDFYEDNPHQAFSFVFDTSGIIFGNSKDFFHQIGLSLSEKENSVLVKLSDSSIDIIRQLGNPSEEKDPQVIRINLNQIPYLIAVQRISSTGFGTVVGIPESAIIRSIESQRSSSNPVESKLPVVIAILLFVVFCIVGISMFLFVRAGTPPPKIKPTDDSDDNDNMIIITDEMIEEEMNIKTTEEEISEFVDLIQEDETGTLAHSYNKMVEALQKINELEKKHSIELANANQQLQNEILERQRAEHEIRLLSRRLINSIEEGRRQLARDLHDEFGQMLAAMHLNAESLLKNIPADMVEMKEKIEALIVLIEQLGDKIRKISSELRPDLLDDLGLIPTLEWYVNEFSHKKPEIAINFQAIGFKKRLSSDIEIVLYRIFQECMNNIVKHAKATHVDVILTYNYPKVILMVKDDGVGFDISQRTDGIGLAGMQERTVSANGQIEIRSTLGKGTMVRVELPVSSETNTITEKLNNT